jgi:hypothetical protein
MTDDATDNENDNQPSGNDRPGAPHEGKRKKKKSPYDLLNSYQQNLLFAFFDLFKGLLAAEDSSAANGGHPDDDPAFKDMNKSFAAALGMDPSGPEYKELKQKFRTKGYDWHQDTVATTRLRDAGTLDYRNGSVTSLVKNPPKTLLDLIGQYESTGNYNAILGGKTVNLTGGTINDAIRIGKENVSHGAASSAVGRYQFLSSTLEGLKKEMGLSGNEKFDEAMQDKLAGQLMKRRGLDDYISGKISQEKFMENLSKEWASLPKDISGRGSYDGDKAGNHAARNVAGKEMALLADLKSGTQFNSAATGSGNQTIVALNNDKTPNGPKPA